MDEEKQETTGLFWDTKAGGPLTSEEQRQIKENLTGFFEILNAWQKQENTHGAPRSG